MKPNNYEKTFARGKERALYILQKSDKTEHQIRDKLKQNEYSPQVIDEIVQFLITYHYVDDYRYAQNYIAYKSKTKSYKQIKSELTSKGIGSDIIKEVMQLNDKSECNTIKKYIEKKKINWESVEDSDIHKLVTYLLRKGFPYEQITLVIKEFKTPL